MACCTARQRRTGDFSFTLRVQDSHPDAAVVADALFLLKVLPDLSAPRDLTATSEPDTSITLSWTDSAQGETGYRIERREYGDAAWTWVTTIAPDVDSYNDAQSLSAGVLYEYRVRAEGEGGAEYSPLVTATALAPPSIESQPSDMVVLPGNEAIVSVGASGGDLSYQWYEGEAGNTAAPIAGATASALTLSEVNGSKTYWVQVSNLAGVVNSASATISTSYAAPSLKVNLGAVGASVGWNSLVDFSVFEGAASSTDDTLVYANGAPATGVTMTLTRSSIQESFCHVFNAISLAAYTADWLDDGAAASAWAIGLDGHSLSFSVEGLPAGTYTIEAYVHTTPTAASATGTTYPAYRLSANTMRADWPGVRFRR